MQKMSSKQNESGTSILLLTKLQYCHVIDNNTGVVRLVEGPYRGPLESNEQIYGRLTNKLIVKEGQYANILNPYDAKAKDVKQGDREVRIGPMIFSLYPGEYLENSSINDEYVLEEDEGLLIKANKIFDDKGTPRKPGDLWIIEGPATYIPHKYSQVEKKVHSTALGPEEGVYVKNIRTGEIRLEQGPKTIMLSPIEEYYEKEYTTREFQALKLDEDLLEAEKAIPLRLLKSEAMMITSGEKQRVEFGPKIILLKPFEKPYIMSISGETPKVPSVLKIWKVLLGPVFSTDALGVRTKDNAELQIRLRYKWRFKIEKEQPEKIFAVADFIGFATETMAGMIREEAAKHNFEDFHSMAAELIKTTVFSKGGGSFVFEENGFEIFGIDIKKIAPEDAEIAQQLNEAIKSNMEVYVNKIQQQAKLEAERELVQGKIAIEQSKGELIALEQTNIRANDLGLAKIEAESTIERARGQAEAIKIKKRAENDEEIAKIKNSIEVLKQEGSESYIKLQQVLSFANVDKTIVVPTDSKLFIPMGNMDNSGSLKKMIQDEEEN
jgi:major vault protein